MQHISDAASLFVRFALFSIAAAAVAYRLHKTVQSSLTALPWKEDDERLPRRAEDKEAG